MKKSFDQLIVQMNVVTDEQLNECLEQARLSGRSLQEVLAEKDFVVPEDLAKAYAAYASLSYIDQITEKMADVALLAKIPLKFLRDNSVIPLIHEENVVIVTTNPLEFQPLDAINLLLGGGATYAVSTQKVITDAINRYYPIEGAKQMIEELEEEEDIDESVEFDEVDEKDIVSMATEAPIIKLVNHILFQAAKRGASDIHVEPFEKKLVVRYRIDGVLYNVMTPPKRVQSALLSRVKIMAHLNIAEKRIPQDGRIDIRVSGRPIDIRVSVLPVAFGERVVMRLLDKTRSFSELKDLGFSDRDYELIIDSIYLPNGIIYITGPTGSGKTTTLYSILSKINRPEINVITVEDPVEYQMAGIGQVQVREKVGLTFAASLRSILRQDPDVIMIGETRDQETAQIAVQAALTGHLVLSTLHTNSAPATITRLLDMGVEPYLIASSVTLAMAQRLVRKLCGDCKIPYAPPLDLLTSIGLSEKEAQAVEFYEPKGCEGCNNMGYRGRIPIFELMKITPAIAQLTMDRADTAKIKSKAIAQGMTPLVEDGVRKIKQGLTTIEEVLSVATIEQGVVE